ncbi:hypothetical protein [Paenibacillus tyrfis]|uniref:hypothetical protein n=1 Tax=Paenibacillus tyrfis TaxID=1501230 RepID=UPI000563ADD7|nr:hypothetical protein [Paenibacillus tyrfis]
MAYTGKTDWKYDEVVTEDDMNRIEKGVMDAHEELQGVKDGIRADKTKPLVVEVRTSDPDSPAMGRMWIRSDL